MSTNNFDQTIHETDHNHACDILRDKKEHAENIDNTLHTSDDCSEHSLQGSLSDLKTRQPNQTTQNNEASHDNHSEQYKCDMDIYYSAVIQEIKVDDDFTVYELYIDGYMIQEHSKSPLNYDATKSDSYKKND